MGKKEVSPLYFRDESGKDIPIGTAHTSEDGTMLLQLDEDTPYGDILRKGVMNEFSIEPRTLDD